MFKPLALVALLGASSSAFSQTNLFRLPAADRARAAYVLCDDLAEVAEGRAALRIGGKYGYADLTGRIVIPARGALPFDEAGPFGANGLARVRVGAKAGYINRAGEWIVPATFDHAGDFENRPLAFVGRGEHWGALGVDGREVIAPTFLAVQWLGESTLGLQNDTGWALADRQGRPLTPFHFDALGNELGPGAEGLIPVRRGDRWGYAELATGRVVVAPEYDQVGRFADGAAPVVRAGKAGYIDRTGRAFTEFRFDGADEFSEGFAAVRIGDRWGYLDRQGRAIIPPTYDSAYKFSRGVASVTRGDEWLTINARNETVPAPTVPETPAEPSAPANSPQPVEGAQNCSVRLDPFNLGLSLDWDGAGRAHGVRVFRLDSAATLAWDARLAAGKVSDGLFLVGGGLAIFEPTQEFSVADLEAELAAAVQRRAAQLTARPVTVTAAERRALLEVLKAVAADLERVETLARDQEWARFRFDAGAADPTDAAARRVRDAREWIAAVKALTTRIDRAFRDHPALNAEQRAALDAARGKSAENVQRLLDLK